jgi:pyruvate/2-oxoglutarate/acetoin dehydrogenase E1 component
VGVSVTVGPECDADDRYRAAGEWAASNRSMSDRAALTTVEQVPIDDYTLPLGDIEILREGTDLTLVSYGTPLYTCSASLNSPYIA